MIKLNRKIFGLIILAMSLFIFNSSKAETIEIPNPVKHVRFQELLEAVLTFLQYVGAVIVVLVLIAGAFKFINAGGNPEKVKEGFHLIFWAIVGLFIIIAAKAFVSFVSSVIEGP